MKTYDGICVGGPWAGLTSQSRFPKGFVLVDRSAERVWVYDRIEVGDAPTGTSYVAREMDVLDWSRLEKAAAEPKYDVRAWDDGLIPDDLEVGR